MRIARTLLFAAAGIMLFAGCYTQEINRLEFRLSETNNQVAMLQDELDSMDRRMNGLESAGVAVVQTPYVPPAGNTGWTPPATTGNTGGPNRQHVRVVSMPHTEQGRRNCQEVQAFLERSGIRGAVVRTSTGTRTGRSYWVVDVGDFAAADDPTAVRLRDQIRGLTYQGRRDFRSAHIVGY